MHDNDGVTVAQSGNECGAASLALGAVLAVMVPPTLQLALALMVNGYRGFSRFDQRLAAIGGYGAVALILVLALVGCAFGVVGMVKSGRRGRPIALAVAGLLLNGVDVLMWIAVGLAWHGQAWTML
jgi:hypothetical protein